VTTYLFAPEAEKGNLTKPFVFIPQPGMGGSLQYIKGGAYKAKTDVIPDGEEMNISGITDWYGRPVFGDLTLRRKENDGDEMRFMNAVITVEQTKTIVQTALQGRNGSITEYIAMAGHIITVNGSLIGEAYPKDETEKLVRMLQESVPLKAVSEFLMMFNIYDVICNYYKFPQEITGECRQLVELKFISHEDHELTLE
jgi:hypothetical protein